MNFKQSIGDAKESGILHTRNKLRIMGYLYKLPQQLPMTKEFYSTQLPKLSATPVSISSSIISNNVNTLPKSHLISSMNSTYTSCKKLRIMSQNGKDLGEFKVELRNNSSLTEQVYTITKSDAVKFVAKPVTPTLTPNSTKPMKLTKIRIPRLLEKHAINSVQNNVMNVTPEKKYTNIRSNRINILSRRSASNKNNQIIKKTETCSNKISDKKISENSDNKTTFNNEASLKSFLHCTANDGNQKQCEVKNLFNIPSNNTKHIVSNVNTLMKFDKVKTSTTPFKDSKVSFTTGNISYKEIAESPYPIVRCKKLVLNSIINNYVPNKAHKRKYISTPNAVKSKKIYIPSDKILNYTHAHSQNKLEQKSNSAGTVSNNIEVNEEARPSESESNLIQLNPNLICKAKQMHEKRAQKDIMTIVPNHNSVSFNKNVSMMKHNTNDNNSKEKLVHKDSLLNNDVQFVSELREITDIINADNVESNDPSSDCSKNSLSQKDMTEQWDVIKRAVKSVKDEELRAQALKALADCGIGVERHVPKPLPKELKSVHDTQVQTMVFGLLDPRFFVLINNDIENIQRLQQVTFQDIAQMQNMLLQNNLIADSNKQPTTLKNSDLVEEGDFDIENFISQICEENLDALQVKETLSATNTKCQKIIDQLQKDLEFIKKYDEDGMLAIHNAVINNNIFDVRRYLMILKQSKESVDLLTQDRETSLELAIKYDVRGDIVKLLLQSGAQPVIQQLVHESALIIAAKRSSAMLPMLISHVSNRKLLDLVDSEGFAALHYCCRCCDIDGVNALIAAGANVNVQDMKSGRTPLFHALESVGANKSKVIQKLLQAGAITTVSNFAGFTPLSITADGKSAPFMLLRKDSAQISSPAQYLVGSKLE